MMEINFHIDRLVLEGLPLTPSQGAAVQAAIEAELARLISDNGLAPAFTSSLAIPRLAASNIQLSGEKNPTRLGQQIAQALFAGIGNEKSKSHAGHQKTKPLSANRTPTRNLQKGETTLPSARFK
jgi:hypothetical protein